MTSSINSCPRVVSSNTANLVKVIISPPANCPGGSSFTLSQNASVDANCVISQAQTTAVEQSLQTSADARAGLGLSGSNSKQVIVTEVRNIINNNCGDSLASNTLNIPELTISACTSNIPQVANAKVACQLQNIQNLSNKLQATNASSAAGWSLDFGSIGNILIVLAVIGIIGGLVFFVVKMRKKN